MGLVFIPVDKRTLSGRVFCDAVTRRLRITMVSALIFRLRPPAMNHVLWQSVWMTQSPKSSLEGGGEGGGGGGGEGGVTVT